MQLAGGDTKFDPSSSSDAVVLAPSPAGDDSKDKETDEDKDNDAENSKDKDKGTNEGNKDAAEEKTNTEKEKEKGKEGKSKDDAEDDDDDGLGNLEDVFSYHKKLFPMDVRHDAFTIACAIVGLIIAASGGIGGGGILVPIYMLVLGFKPKHAIALSNFTILGGSIANTTMNCRKRHPKVDKQIIDWDLILIMEPLTIFGAVLGSLMGKVLPNIILTVSLVIVLAFMGQRTLTKGLKMWRQESESLIIRTSEIELESSPFESSARTIQRAPDPEQEQDKSSQSASGAGPAESTTASSALGPAADAPCDPLPAAAPENSSDRDNTSTKKELAYCELESDAEGSSGPRSFGAGEIVKPVDVKIKVATLACCFVGICLLTVLKGGGHFKSPLGVTCGSSGYWLITFSTLPWVLMFALGFRWLLVREYESKVRSGHTFIQGEVRWTKSNTLKYPAICAISGLLAGLFGVGGGIVKGPLMLEMGIIPQVASASAAAMILFTAAAATTSFLVFGLLHLAYGTLFFVLGFFSTLVGQLGVGYLVERHGRQSPIVLSIGTVICLSAALVLVQDVVAVIKGEGAALLEPHGICSLK